MRKKLPFRPAGAYRALAATARVLVFFLMVCSFQNVFSQAQLLNDIGAVEDQWDFEYNYLIDGNGTLYFVEVNQLWKSDGTVAGTVKLKGFERLLSPFWIGNTLYFTADDGVSGSELWMSDGTTEGTIRVKDIHAGSGSSSPSNYTNVDGTLFFVADDGVHGKEVWKTDGTAAGTVLVKDIIRSRGSSNPSFLTNANGVLFFSANDAQHGYELWKSNGTDAGTVLVKDINTTSGSSPESLVASGGSLYFVANNGASGKELWKSDGTATGTLLVKDIMPGSKNSGIANMTDVNGTLFFTANDGVYGHELWKTNGTSSGTVLVKDMTPGGSGSHGEHFWFNYRMAGFRNMNGILFFAAFERDTYYIWKSDGTAQGTIPLQEAMGPGIGTPSPQFTYMNGAVYYFNGTAIDYQEEYFLYRMNEDGSNPQQLKQLTIFDYYNPYYPLIVNVGDHIYVAGQIGGGTTLIKSDGTREGTAEFLDVRDGTISSFPEGLTTFNGKVYFGTGIWEYPYIDYISNDLWVTDGTPAGTGPLLSGVESARMIASDNLLFVTGAEAFVNKLWKVDKAGAVTELKTLESMSITRMVMVNNILFFHTDGQVWRSDGTPEGTIPLFDTEWITSFAAVGNALMFVSRNANRDEELWKSGGTPATTLKVKTIRVGPAVASRNYPTAVLNNILYFVANDGVHGNEIWRTDGTAAGTYMALDINANDKVETDYSEYDITSLEVWNNTLYISARQIASGEDFWSLRSYPGSGTSTGFIRTGDPFVDMLADQDKLYLVAQKPSGVSELWVYRSGEPLVMLAGGLEGGTPDFEIVSGVMYFGDRYGRAVWRTDGTPCGTFQLNTGTHGGYEIEAIGNQLIFASATNDTGVEPFAFDLAQDPGNPCEPVGECTASGTITREYWSGVQGNRVSDIPVDKEPDTVNELNLFEAPSNVGTNYGARIRGHICPPFTGNYYFYIASNDHSELWLSDNDDPARKVRIAYVAGATGIREWNKFSSQRSVAIPLVQGKRYYIEALHKQGVGTDNLAVGWDLPGGTTERPIAGKRLSPFENSAVSMASDTEAESFYGQINIYPNPAISGQPSLTISGYDGIEGNVETQVEIINMTGEVVFRNKISCGGNCSEYMMNVNNTLVPGIYVVNMNTKGVRSSKRLLVR